MGKSKCKVYRSSLYSPYHFSEGFQFLKKKKFRSGWVARLCVRLWVLAGVTISQVVGWDHLGEGGSALSREPAYKILSCAPPSTRVLLSAHARARELAHSLALTQILKNKKF